ncbi:hypothetical protein IJ182_04670 [bacterium]|nr:hypothetical protein [bacterium]
MFSYPLLTSGWQLVPGAFDDARLINYILEHGYLYFHHEGTHLSFFNISMFYPAINTLSYSDMLLGGMLIYIPIRELVNNPTTALQAWFIIVCIFNYYSMYLLLHKRFKFNIISSSVGAFIFAFGLPRENQIGHLQLFLQFYMILSILAFTSLSSNKSRLYNNICFLTGIILFALQIYSSFYIGWYMVFGLVNLCIILLLFNETRLKFFNFIIKYKHEIIIYSLLSIILLIPLIKHYLSVGTQFLWIQDDILRTTNIRGIIANRSILDKYIFNNYFNSHFLQNIDDEHIIGIGYITSIIIIISIYLCKNHRKYFVLFLLIVYTLFISKTMNLYLYKIFPGSSAIRSGSRFIFLILPIYSYLIAYFMQNIITSKIFIKTMIFMLIIIEQIAIPYYSWTKQGHLSRLEKYIIPQNCNILYFDINKDNEEIDYCLLELDIMWKLIYTDKYTVNGYSGYEPQHNKGMISPNCTIRIKD